MLTKARLEEAISKGLEMGELHPRPVPLPFNVVAYYEDGSSRSWTQVNYDLTDRWLKIFAEKGNCYFFTTEGIKQITAYKRVENEPNP